MVARTTSIRHRLRGDRMGTWACKVCHFRVCATLLATKSRLLAQGDGWENMDFGGDQDRRDDGSMVGHPSLYGILSCSLTFYHSIKQDPEVPRKGSNRPSSAGLSSQAANRRHVRGSGVFPWSHTPSLVNGATGGGGDSSSQAGAPFSGRPFGTPSVLSDGRRRSDGPARFSSFAFVVEERY